MPSFLFARRMTESVCLFVRHEGRAERVVLENSHSRARGEQRHSAGHFGRGERPRDSLNEVNYASPPDVGARIGELLPVSSNCRVLPRATEIVFARWVWKISSSGAGMSSTSALGPRICPRLTSPKLTGGHAARKSTSASRRFSQNRSRVSRGTPSDCVT